MRLVRRALALAAIFMMTGCERHYIPPDSPTPPNTILLSSMMSELSAQSGFTEAFLREIRNNNGGKRGPALLTPNLVDELRKRILGKDWGGLDRFPGWTMHTLNPTVRSIDYVAHSKRGYDVAEFLDLGPYALNQEHTIDFDQPSSFPPFTTKGIVTQLGDGVQRGDGPNQLAPEHAESQQLADALNRLAANSLDGAKPFKVMRPWPAIIARRPLGPPMVYKPITFTTTPEDLIYDLQATGHTVTVTDARYFANFGHLHFKGEDVMMPFWINTGYAVPGSGGPFDWGGRPLLVPVSHAEYEWQIRGPKINADVSYYFGIDGKSEWRTMDTLDQAWVLKRAAHTYTGAQAIEVTRLAGLLTAAYMHQHQRRPDLAFGGYYPLGVCQDGIAAIEHRMTGKTTLFPNTADISLFDDPRDSEVNSMLAAIPKDRSGVPPDPERVFGSLPTEPGANNGFDAVTIPVLSDDLQLSYAAWRQGKLHHIHGRLFYIAVAACVLAGTGFVFGLVSRRQRSRAQSRLHIAKQDQV